MWSLNYHVPFCSILVEQLEQTFLHIKIYCNEISRRHMRPLILQIVSFIPLKLIQVLVESANTRKKKTRNSHKGKERDKWNGTCTIFWVHFVCKGRFRWIIITDKHATDFFIHSLWKRLLFVHFEHFSLEISINRLKWAWLLFSLQYCYSMTNLFN